MQVRVIRFGKQPNSVEVRLGATVRDALVAAGTNPDKVNVTVNSKGVDLDSVVEDGATLTVNPNVIGGREGFVLVVKVV